MLDFFVMLGPEPETLVQQYHAVIGIPAPIPYWVLGFAQSKVRVFFYLLLLVLSGLHAVVAAVAVGM